MTKKTPQPPDDPKQSERFIDKAHEIEADDTEEGADRAFKRVAKRGIGPKAEKCK